jgi:hypothetical protein
MKKTIAMTLCLFLLMESLAWAGLGSDKALYVGGTVNSVKEGSEGMASTKDDKVFVFDYQGGKLQVPYERINDLEYGQKAGRRLGVAIAITWMALFSKKRRHFLTIGYTDDNEKQQAAVFELGKNTVRVTLASLEARTGKKIDYEDDEARKGGRGN